MRWRGILFWNFSVFQVSKSIKSGAWWPIVWGFCENYFSQKVHCDIRFIPKSTVQLSDKSRKIQSHQKQSQFWRYIYLLIFIFWPKNVLLRIQDTHDTYWTALGWDIVWKIHQQHNGDYKAFLVLNLDQLVKSQISCSEPVALLLCQVYQTIKGKSGRSQCWMFLELSETLILLIVHMYSCNLAMPMRWCI